MNVVRPPRRHLLLVGVSVVVALYGGYAAAKWRSGAPVDYYQFWLVGQAIGSLEVVDIYREPDRTAVNAEFRARSERSGSAMQLAASRVWNRLVPTATPFFYALVDLAASGDFERDYRRFQIVSLALYLAGIAALALLLGYPLWSVAPLCVLFTQFFWPFYTDAAFANVGQFQVGLLALLVLALRGESGPRDVASGALLGFLVAFKPTVIHVIGLLVLLLGLERRFDRLARIAAGSAAMLALAAAWPGLHFGAGCSWTSWRAELPALMFTDRYLGGGFLGKLLAVKHAGLYSLFGAALLLSAGGWIARTVRRGRQGETSRAERARESLAMVALGLALYLLSGPIVHSHYFLLAVPAALLALAPGRPHGELFLACLAVFLIAAHPWLQRFGGTPGANHSLWSFLGVGILAVLILVDFTRRREGFASSSGATPRSAPAEDAPAAS